MIDLRSDTVTQPSPAMREAMMAARVGDDVYGEDPTVSMLETQAAEMLGKEAALFSPSGTQSNLLALLSHCERGDEYIVGQLAHTYKYEGGGAAVFGSIQPQPLDFERDGTLDLGKVANAIKPDDFHFARTRLLCLENTHNGQALPPDYLDAAQQFAVEHGLRIHLDGARIFNASVKCHVPVFDISKHFDTVSVCLSKGLGAPVGAVLCGSSEAIKRARRWRKVLGGGMRQAGILAEAGLYALNHNIERLQQDHDNARLLSEGLNPIDSIHIEYNPSQTNMVFMTLPEEAAGDLQAYLKEKNVIMASGKRVRMVTHLDVSEEDIKTVITLIQNFFSG